MAYRVPRRFIAPPQEPPPYGLFALSFVGHALFLLMATFVSAYLASRIPEQVYIVNLVPATPPPLGTPAPRAPEPPAPRPAERTPPRPEAPPVRETPPPKPEKATETVPPRPPKAEPPPAPPRDVARDLPRPTDLALPRQVEKETPKLQSAPLPPMRPIERTPATPPPSAPPRVAEPPRVVAPQAPPVTPPTVTARPAVEATPLGRPDSVVATKGSITLDVNDFPFTYYLRQIHTKIGERWAPPRGAGGGGERAVVLFEIGRDGQIKEPSMEKSSGNALYDQAAVRAVIEASPFPPLPADFKGSSLRVHFGFDFKAEQG